MDEALTAVVAPVAMQLLADQLTPVLAYRRLVAGDQRLAPSFLLESVEQGQRQGRYSFLGAGPALECSARGDAVHIRERDSEGEQSFHSKDPLDALRQLDKGVRFVTPDGLDLPDCALGGWFGYAGYDTVRYTEPEKLRADKAPRDDRLLPDMHFGRYDAVCVFDHARKIVHLVRLVRVARGQDAATAFDSASEDLQSLESQLLTHAKPLAAGRFDVVAGVGAPLASNTTPEQHAIMVERAKEYIRAGDIFQVVLSQRFERRSKADPFDVYRALRAVNPSPYMVYLQAEECILVASSPEILCRVSADKATGARIVTNRPLAGTRKRGANNTEDTALEQELLADPKERAEHIMLVDLGRNDVGKVCSKGSVTLEKVMAVERFSHVMHISSTVTGALRDGLDAWDALRAALPAGTVSGAPKVRAMQIIDELEPVRRGPYGGGFGYVSADGAMDMALALRTMVVPEALYDGETWMYHIQAGGGVVADSNATAEYLETVNKAAALAQAIDLAERAFASST